MARLSDVRSRLAAFPQIVAQIETLQVEMRRVASESPNASLVQAWCMPGYHHDTYQPLLLTPIFRDSEVGMGISVGWHRAPASMDLVADLIDHDRRFLTGRLIQAAKQYDNTAWSTYPEDVQAIGNLAAFALATARLRTVPGLIVAAPSSRRTNSLPFQIAKDVSFLTGIRYAPADTVTFQREITQIKQLNDYWEKRALLHGSMTARPDIVGDRDIVLVDDVCRTGATLRECARACVTAGAASVTVPSASKTFGFQRIPLPTARSWRRVPVLAEEIR